MVVWFITLWHPIIKTLNLTFTNISDANWGSSTQAHQFVTALKDVQSLSEVPDHVKNYRPKLLVFSGPPSHRQPLVDFSYLITKKLSLMICSHVETVSKRQGDPR